MTSPIRTKQKFETFVMTGDTIIKTRSISPRPRPNQKHVKDACVSTSKIDPISGEVGVMCNITSRNSISNISQNLNCTKAQKASNNSELGIPPDDISSDDEFYKETLVDVDYLPPPPDDFWSNQVHNCASSEDKTFVEHQNVSFNELSGQTHLSRHRSYDSITTEGKKTEAEKMPTSLNINNNVDLVKVSVRNYKSHDNYLQLEQSVEFVPVMFDETGAISVDALNYNKIEFPHLKHDPNLLYLQSKDQINENNSITAQVNVTALDSKAQDKEIKSPVYDSLSPDSSVLNCSLTRKDLDLPSAQRLAKRLFTLDGFQQADAAKHLGKKDPFSALVGQEYLKFFNFEGQKLDFALRTFLNSLLLVGETQERERVLAHFSRRYVECNKDFPLSQDSCHTVICAMMLLNIDHHSQSITKKMTLEEFIENLSALNDGRDFQENLLKEVYHSVCNEPFICSLDGANHYVIEESGTSPVIGNNPFLSAPDMRKAREYKRGFVMRKCCIDPDGHRTSLGKRGWRMFYATIKDLVLYLHKDEHGMKRNISSEYQNHHNAIRIHHALAEKASDYIKKQHVFRLTTCDSAQYLFQTSDNIECESWVNCINLVAATLSSAPLPSAVGSQKKFQRPLMPSSHTKLSLMEQLKKLYSCLETLEWELKEHRSHPPEKGTKSRTISDYLDKEGFLAFEVKRFKLYCSLLQPSCHNLSFPHQSLECSSSVALQDVAEESNMQIQGGRVENFRRSHSDRHAVRPAYLFS